MSKKLRAIIQWCPDGPAIQTIEGFDLPPRTTVEMSFGLPHNAKPSGVVEETFVYISAYKCIDCGFNTDSFDLMAEHQESRKHSLKQKIKRALGLKGTGD